MTRIFGARQLEACIRISFELRGDIDVFRSHVPLVTCLRSSGMRRRHWERLANEVGLAIDLESADFTLAHVLDMGLAQHLDTISKVGDVAVKELAIEEALDKLDHEWCALPPLPSTPWRLCAASVALGAAAVSHAAAHSGAPAWEAAFLSARPGKRAQRNSV